MRQNIIFNQKIDMNKYVDTIQFCELERDLEIMEKGDSTMVGENGTTLSGGQQARLGLARAVYQDKDIYLLDDPISALDAHVRLNIMKNVVNGMLKEKTRLLVTHAIDFCHMADRIVMMDQGKITAQGTYDEMQYNDEFIKLQEINALNKDDVKNHSHNHPDKKEETEEVQMHESVAYQRTDSMRSLKRKPTMTKMCSRSCRHKEHNHPWNKSLLEEIDENEGAKKAEAVYPSTLSKNEKEFLLDKFS